MLQAMHGHGIETGIELTLYALTTAPWQVLHKGSQLSCGMIWQRLQHCMLVEL